MHCLANAVYQRPEMHNYYASVSDVRLICAIARPRNPHSRVCKRWKETRDVHRVTLMQENDR